jgi:hypothetical protein
MKVEMPTMRKRKKNTGKVRSTVSVAAARI